MFSNHKLETNDKVIAENSLQSAKKKKNTFLNNM